MKEKEEILVTVVQGQSRDTYIKSYNEHKHKNKFCFIFNAYLLSFAWN